MKNLFRLALLAAALLAPSLAGAANRFLTCTVTCTITAADTSIWGTTTGGTGASVPGSSDAVILDGATCVGGVTCTATMGAAYNPTWQSITMGTCTAATTGCILDFSVNNNNITLSVAFSATGTGVRKLLMGSGTWTITGNAGSIWTIATATNMTLDAGTSTLVLNSGNTANNRTFSSGALNYNALSVSANTTLGALTLSDIGTTYATLTIAAPNTLFVSGAGTRTVTTAPTFTGTLAGPISFIGSPLGTSGTISVATGTVTCTFCAIRNLTGAGGATFSAPSSLDLGGNSGITITAPASGSGGHIIGG